MRIRKARSAPEGAPDWVVTFGDMMSLLLCFFVLLLDPLHRIAIDQHRSTARDVLASRQKTCFATGSVGIKIGRLA